MKMEYLKQISVRDDADVVVCGGGVAGFTAAVSAGRLGMRTVLIEKHTVLGGILTAGGNSDIALFYAGDRQIIAGIGWEFVTRLAEKHMAEIPEFSWEIPHSRQGVAVNIPAAACLMDRMCAEAGVTLLLDAQVVDAAVSLRDGRRTVDHLIVATKEGLIGVKGGMYVDATGDGDVCALAGAAYEIGNADKNELQPGTLRFFPRGYDKEKIDRAQVQAAYEAGLAAGEIRREDFWNGSPYSMFMDDGNNTNHILIDSTDHESRVQAELAGRVSLMRITDWARGRVCGAENFFIDTAATEVAPRESRRIIGEMRITVEQYMSGEVYADAVAYSFYPIDLHKSGEKTLDKVYLDRSVVPTIPLRAMIPKGYANILTAGRCISGDRRSNSAYRVKASCMAMGEAAGTACAVAVRSHCDMHSVDVEEVRRILKEHGAIVPDGQKSGQSDRNRSA